MNSLFQRNRFREGSYHAVDRRNVPTAVGGGHHNELKIAHTSGPAVSGHGAGFNFNLERG